MEQCKKCGKELAHVEGRRKKEFCNATCRGLFHYHLKRVEENNKPENKRRILKGRETIPPRPKIKNPITQDECISVEDAIKKDEAEIETLGDSPLANKRRKFLWNRISELKQQLLNQ